jgi:hypothetical protein
MPSSILDFRTLLKALAAIFGTNEFDSKTAAKAVAKYLYSKKKDPQILRRATPKLVSNDLRRLYQMGFLRRRKVLRKCKNKKGKEYNCGYKYVYKITAQGWRYLEYLSKKSSTKKNPYLTLGEIVEVLRWARIAAEKVLLMKLLEKGDLEGSWRVFLAIDEEINQLFSSPGFRRFQTKELLFKREVSQAVAFYLAVIQEFENQIKQRDLMINFLMEELRKCREQKNRLGTLNLPVI